MKSNFLRSIAIKYFNLGFNVLPVAGKIPTVPWDKWQTERQTLSDVETMSWNSKTTGVGATSGIEYNRFIDIDKIENWEVIDLFRDKLKLPKDYPWITLSGSKAGVHFIFKCHDDDKIFKKLGGKKGVYKFKLKIEGYCEHIEIRWSESQTLLPYSKHPSGNLYEFFGNEPTQEPIFIDAETFCEFIEDLLEIEPKYNDKPKTSITDTDFNEAELSMAIDFLSQKLGADSYDKWLTCGFALASLGEAGRIYFQRMSLNNPNYKDTPEAIDKKFDNLLAKYDGRANLSTLFYIAKEHGFVAADKNGEKEDAFEKAIDYLNNKYDFQYNILKQKLFWKKKDAEKFREVTDRALTSLFIELKSKKKIGISFENLKRLLNSDFVPQFDPLADYLYSLPEWDEIDYIEQLSETVKVETGTEDEWKLCLRRWLIGTVACSLSDRDVNQTAIILQGPQGIGKTRWINSLIPEKLGEYLFVGNITPNDKDSKLAVVKNFLINLDELETLNRDEIGFLKSLMTQKELQLRKPYGYFEEIYKRRSSFAGSINKLEFLNDPTGSRRFLCFSVIEVDYEHGIDMDMVFSQVMHLYSHGEAYWFNKAESDKITANNMKFTFQPFEEQLVLEKFESCAKDDPDLLLMNSTEIAKEIMGDKPITNNMLRQIGMALTKYGFEKGHAYSGGHSIKKWRLKRIKASGGSII